MSVGKKARGSKAVRLFGLRLRMLRKQRGLTQAELAHRVGCDISHLGAIERGHRAATIRTAELVAAHLKVPIGALFDFAHVREETDLSNRLRDRLESLLREGDRRTMQTAYRVLDGMAEYAVPSG
jgi:transcriptional regulator with XRE-family HTH domain